MEKWIKGEHSPNGIDWFDYHAVLVEPNLEEAAERIKRENPGLVFRNLYIENADAITIERLKKIFEEELGFNVHLSEQDSKVGAEIEDWTEGGVDMIMWIHPFTAEEFKRHAESFDIDEAIDLNRQDPSYRNAFTYTRSVADFEKWAERLKNNIQTLVKLGLLCS